MNAIANLLQSTCRAIGFGSEIIGYTVGFGQSLASLRSPSVLSVSSVVEYLLRSK